MNLQNKNLKTYTFSEILQNKSSFDLKGLEVIYQNSNGENDIPHRHDYYTIIFIEKGEGIHFVDFTEYKIEDQSIYFILPGQIHRVAFTSIPKGYIITFTEEFLIANSIPEKLINEIYLFNDYGLSPPLNIADMDLIIYQNLVAQMNYFAKSLQIYTQEAVGSLVKVFLIQCNNDCNWRKSNNPQLIETSNHILRKFKQLLNKNYTTVHLVSNYAFELDVTSDYLNKIVKNTTGKSVKDHIQNKLIIEAKRSLLFSNISNKELAYALGFEESAHFNNFFKKMTGKTPSEFRLLSRNS